MRWCLSSLLPAGRTVVGEAERRCCCQWRPAPQETQEIQGGGGGRAGPTRQVGLEDSEEGNELRLCHAGPHMTGWGARSDTPGRPSPACGWTCSPSARGGPRRWAGEREPRAEGARSFQPNPRAAQVPGEEA